MLTEYTYEIISVDSDARCMEVIYRSDGRQEMHMGVRLPWEGESLEAVIHAHAPVIYWQEQDRVVQSVQVGTTGVVAVPQSEQSDESDQANYEMLFEASVEQKVAKALVKFGVLQSDPTAVEVTQL